jgi:tetratricopeptide (TPR) repeat protein
MTSDPDINSAEAISLANTYADARNYRRAEEVLRSALVHDPHNAGLLTELARAEHLRGDNAAAEQSARDALAITPEDAYAMRIYASILFELRRRREGLSWARRAVDAAPYDHLTHYEYARLLAMAGDAAAALPVATEALRLAPASADAHDLMGVVYGMLGRRAESTAEHTEALRLEPGHARALANIAVNRANSRNLAGALAGFTEAGRLDPHIGDDIRRNITATVRQWMSWTTVAAWAALWLINQVERNNDGPTTTSGARVIAGLGFVVLVVMFGWLARSVPRNLWGPMLRQREFRSLKIYLGLGVVVLGVLGAFAAGALVNFWVLAGALLVTVVVSWVAPRFDKDWLDKVRFDKH